MAIIGAHVLLYSSDAEKLRAVFRDTFGFHNVDAGDGWLIFRLPPAELGIHPAGGEEGEPGVHALSLMCDDINATIAELRARGIDVDSPPEDHGYGIVTMARLPGGVEVQIYEPRHPVAIDRTR